MRHLEDALQEAVCKLLAVYEAQGRLRYYAVPNGGRRNPREVVRMKKQGLRPGVPDLVICAPHGQSMFWELKSPKGRVTPQQKDWLAWLDGAGFNTFEIRSLEQAQEVLDLWLDQREAA